MIPLVILAVLAAVVGGTSLSNATLGVGIIAIGCLLGILARIAQSSAQHQAVLRAMGVTPAPGVSDPSTLVTCPKCAETFTRGPSTCPHCGSALT